MDPKWLDKERNILDYDMFDISPAPANVKDSTSLNPPPLKPPQNDQIPPKPVKNDVQNKKPPKHPQQLTVKPENSPRQDDDQMLVKIFHLEDDNWLEVGSVGILLYKQESPQALGAPKKLIKNETPNSPPKTRLLLKVVDKASRGIVMAHVASKAIRYKKDSDTIIAWAEGAEEVAISFEKKEHCDRIFALLGSVEEAVEMAAQKSEGSAPAEKPQVAAEDSLEQKLERIRHLLGRKQRGAARVLAPSRRHLGAVLAAFVQGGGGVQEQFKSQEHLDEWFDFFDRLEAERDFAALEQFFFFARALLLQGDHLLFSRLLSARNVLRLIAALEYSPDQLLRARQARLPACDSFRRAISDSKCKALPVEPPPGYEAAAAYVARLTFFKNVVFARHFDDLCQQRAKVFVAQKQLELLRQLLADDWLRSSFLGGFLAALGGSDCTPYPETGEAESFAQRLAPFVAFLGEFCQTLWHLPYEEKCLSVPPFFQTSELYAALDAFFRAADPAAHEPLWLAAVEVVFVAAALYPAGICAFAEQNGPGGRMRIFPRLVEVLAASRGGEGLLQAVSKVLQRVLGSTEAGVFFPPPGAQAPPPSFVRRLVSGELPKLLKAMESEPGQPEEAAYQSLECFAVLAAGLQPEEAAKAAGLSRAAFRAVRIVEDTSRSTRLHLSALRLLRACAQLNHASVTKALVLGDAVSAVVKLMRRNGERRENLLSATLLSFFAAVAAAKVEPLLRQIRTRFSSLSDLDAPVFLKIFAQKGDSQSYFDRDSDEEMEDFSKTDSQSCESDRETITDTKFVERPPKRPFPEAKVDLCAFYKKAVTFQGEQKKSMNITFSKKAT